MRRMPAVLFQSDGLGMSALESCGQPDGYSYAVYRSPPLPELPHGCNTSAHVSADHPVVGASSRGTLCGKALFPEGISQMATDVLAACDRGGGAAAGPILTPKPLRCRGRTVSPPGAGRESAPPPLTTRFAARPRTQDMRRLAMASSPNAATSTALRRSSSSALVHVALETSTCRFLNEKDALSSVLAAAVPTPAPSSASAGDALGKWRLAAPFQGDTAPLATCTTSTRSPASLLSGRSTSRLSTLPSSSMKTKSSTRHLQHRHGP